MFSPDGDLDILSEDGEFAATELSRSGPPPHGSAGQGTDDQDAESPRSWSSVLSPARVRVGVSSWLETGKQLSSRVHALVKDTAAVSPASPVKVEADAPLTAEDVPVSPQLMKSVALAFRRQEEINKANANLCRLNYAVNVANYVKHKQVEQAVIQGQKQLWKLNNRVHHQTETIGHLQDGVRNLSTQVQLQKETAQRMKNSIDAQQQLFSSTILENRMELERQQSLLTKQQAAMDMMGLLKSWSVKCGLHNSVGSLLPYIQHASTLAMGKLQELRAVRVWRRRPALPPDQEDSEDRPPQTALNLC
uniref:Uncharacterized protein n=1 Tax=Branchiostoma floridae TaxID=7739 RepID=C3Y4B6_BRAFL|eukprot:XP_002609132.1 hypothetical protein BRAFLDRAFT_126156 [Branchiostoma floridae]